MLTQRLATATHNVQLAHLGRPDFNVAVHDALVHVAAATAALAAACPPQDGPAVLTAIHHAHELRDAASRLPGCLGAPERHTDAAVESGTDVGRLTRDVTELLSAVHERCLDACLTGGADDYLAYSRIALQSAPLVDLLTGRAAS